MSLSNVDTFSLLLALILLLGCAHLCGDIVVRLRQPRVAGEILGGLFLGPTLFGLLLPNVQRSIFHDSPATGWMLGAIYQLGLFLLMFCSGAALRSSTRRDEHRATALIAIVGNVIPFAAGLLFVRLFDTSGFLGSAQNRTAFALVFACGLAITSIPVISKIMADLGILSTSFARIVLAVAVVEDIALYVVVSVALGMVAPSHGDPFTLPSLLSIRPGSIAGNLYYVIASVAFFTLPLLLGRRFLDRIASHPGNILQRSSPTAFAVMFVFTLTALALFIGVAAYFGAFVAGILARELRGASAEAHEVTRRFSFAFFIPIYFAIVGLRLDLIRQFDVPFFLLFLTYACILKAVSVYAGARLAGIEGFGARNLAIALNARGGPAIVLASVAFDAHIINQRFTIALVMLALVTSAIAGSWLDLTLPRIRTTDASAADGLLTDKKKPAEEPAVAAPAS
jgi:Kef-type K+ transport system membrane component KefB